MEKRKIQTSFRALVRIQIPNGITGGGWNAVQNYLYIPPGKQFEISTNQTISLKEEDKTMLLHYGDQTIECQFENLGRLLACGAAKQIDVTNNNEKPYQTAEDCT
jgi:hypothetical protein